MTDRPAGSLVAPASAWVVDPGMIIRHGDEGWRTVKTVTHLKGYTDMTFTDGTSLSLRAQADIDTLLINPNGPSGLSDMLPIGGTK